MTALLDCPAEILHSIFEHLPTSSLHALCLVTKRLHQVAEPLLYTRIDLIWERHRPPPIISLLRTIQNRPQLATHVERLTLHALSEFDVPGGFGYRQLPCSIPTDGTDLAGFIATIQDIDSPLRDLWIQELQNGTMDAFVMLLLSYVRNITHLRITGVFARANRLLGMMLRAALCQDLHCRLPWLHSLQDVVTEPGWTQYRYNEPKNTADILPMFYLPSVRSITAEIDNPAIFAWPTYAPNPSHITTLDLKIIREGHLGRILATTKNLKVLKWRWEYEQLLKDEFNSDVIKLDQITADLTFVKETLECLHLSAMFDNEYWRDTLTVTGSMKGLRNFERLQRLEIPQLFLMGFSPVDNLGCFKDLMPKNIHHLVINDDSIWLEGLAWQDRDLFDKLERWWDGNMHHTPWFTSFKLSLEWTDEQWCAGLRQELSDLCARLGIQLEIYKELKDLGTR
ncbi:hypothetical protein HDV57DRAFT_419399 [Trichoderma longibrachiatum]|uniref:F-box domain-containing protein n=1 Tax=Trichoderma longibrachiatum ATCC 18648 TaxID=983965 RepID=A0A2T4C378_TRILO|nr:hypothetical protein M440DRAFT_1334477 [Trichoderma longibrachiatum ATCC 18648]